MSHKRPSTIVFAFLMREKQSPSISCSRQDTIRPYMRKKLILIVIAIAIVGGRNLCQARQSFIAALSSLNEVPPNNLSTMDGTYGVGYFSLMGLTLSVTGGFYDYSYPVAEISLYDGPVSGPTLLQLNIDPDVSPVGGGLFAGTFSGSGVLTSAEVTDLENGDFYINIQTDVSEMAAQPGEMSGELTEVPEPGAMILMGSGSVTWLATRRRKT